MKSWVKKQIVLITLLGGFGLLLVFILIFSFKNPTQNSSVPFATSTASDNKPEKLNPGLPMRLKIPKINVDAALDYVNLTPQGDMDIPNTPANAGWYRKGPRPGEAGNSVIDGHFGWVDNVPAVFDNLHKLKKGDKVQIEAEKGVTITFVVRELRMYTPNEDATAVFRSSDGTSHLNLITCQGAWNKTQQSYSNRLVVFTDKET